MAWLLGGCGEGSASVPAGDGQLASDLSATAPPTDAASGDMAEVELVDPATDPVALPQWSTTPAPLRSEAEVCAAWTESEASAPSPYDPATACDPGTLPAPARSDGMRRLNFYRWLSGVPYSTEATAFLADVQTCAFYQGANQLPISHDPEPTHPCYTRTASDTAAVANLAGGVPNVSAAIDLFTTDTAHRVLILAPGLAATALGFYESVACQLVFAENWTWEPPPHQTIALPAPGPNPQPPTALFTVQPATGHTYDEGTTATVTVDGVATPTTTTLQTTGYGTQVLEILLPEAPSVGQTVAVEVAGIETAIGARTESYSARFVECP